MGIIDNKIGLLNEKTISIKVKTDKGGHLYKKLHAKEIADAIKINWNIIIPSDCIEFDEEVRMVGEYYVKIQGYNKSSRMKTIVATTEK